MILYKACGKLGDLPLVKNSIDPSLYLQYGAAGGSATGGWQGGWPTLRTAVQAGADTTAVRWPARWGDFQLGNYSDVEK
jgi:hypothetical protein